MDTVIASLLRYEANRPLAAVPRIAIGYGACRDLFVDGSHIMANQSFPDNPEHFLAVGNADELRRMYAYFFKAGAAAERFVSDEKLWRDLVALGEQQEGHRWELGGNAPVMAARFAKEGANVLLAAKEIVKAMVAASSKQLGERSLQGERASSRQTSTDDLL